MVPARWDGSDLLQRSGGCLPAVSNRSPTTAAPSARYASSIKKVVRALRPIQQITTIGGHPHTAADPLTDAAQDILTATSHDSATH